MVYYQGNELKFCFEMQDMAYDCLDYLLLGKEEYIDFCKETINCYLGLRKEKITDKQKELWLKNKESIEYTYIKLDLLE
jgi:hypothetical protein